MMWFIFAGKELFRKKIILITCVLTLCFVALYSWGLWKISRMTEGVGDSPVQQLLDGAMVLSLGLLFAQMIAAFLVFFSTMGAVSGEVESGLMLAQLARPIPRWKIYMGKYAGIACWMLLYNAVLFWAILLPVHVLMDFPLLPLAVMKSFLLFLFIPLLLLALSLLGSTLLPTLGNGAACAMLYGLGLFSGFADNLFNLGKTNLTVSNASLLISLLIPSDSLSRRLSYEIVGGPDLPLTTDMLRSMGPFSIANVPSITFLIYTVVYGVLLLLIGCTVFHKKDIA